MSIFMRFLFPPVNEALLHFSLLAIGHETLPMASKLKFILSTLCPCF